MRLWSLHPSYLDAKGLVACWREGLLARKVLDGKTKGYKNHPQLERFKKQLDPIKMLDSYLLAIYDEADRRGYNFNREKIGTGFSDTKIEVTEGQLEYEMDHLAEKLKARDPKKYEEIKQVVKPKANHIFQIVKGNVEPWERIGK